MAVYQYAAIAKTGKPVKGIIDADSPAAAGQTQSLLGLVDSSVRENENEIELTFAAGARTYTIALNKTGEVGGHIHIEEDGEMLVDRPLTQEIMPQAGLALSE